MRKRMLGMAIAGLIVLVLLAGLPGVVAGQETPVTATPLPTNTTVPATATSAPATATSAPSATAVPEVVITAVPAVTATPTVVVVELPVTGQSNSTGALLGLVPVVVLLLLALPAMRRLRARRR